MNHAHIETIHKHVERIATTYGLPKDKLRSIALHVAADESADAKEMFADNGWFRDTYCDNIVIRMMTDPACGHLFVHADAEIQAPEPGSPEATKAENEKFYASEFFLSLPPQTRMAEFDKREHAAVAAKKAEERKAIDAKVAAALAKIPDAHTWSPERRANFHDQIAAQERTKARKD